VTLQRNFSIPFTNNNKNEIKCYVSMAILSMLFYLVILCNGEMLVSEDVLLSVKTVYYD
jgi:hypothetical protein